jgi:predicted XRE-type DNA-binding protein
MDLFERIENFFRRLEVYTKVPPTPAMKHMMVQIMAEVLDILGTATKEMKQSRASELIHRLRSLKSHVILEKFLKKIAGIRKLEDGLKKLDKMTNEEARMANVEALRLTHDIDKKVEGVDEKVQGVSGQVKGVDEKVLGVNENVKVVDEKVQTIIDGTQTCLAIHRHRH